MIEQIMLGLVTGQVVGYCAALTLLHSWPLKASQAQPPQTTLKLDPRCKETKA